MAENAKKVLMDLRKLPGNDECADCRCPDPEWASCSLGLFICQECAAFHRSLGSHISRVKSIKLDFWDNDQLNMMEEHGNLKGRELYEKCVPACWRRPKANDPLVLREQWVRAKYDRKEFMSPSRKSYLNGTKEGYMFKQGKDDVKFYRRKFVLSETEGVLKYYNKDDSKFDPKASLRLDEINVMLVPNKMDNANAMQITYEKDGHTRSVYCYTEKPQDLIEWYMSIRSTKLNRLRIAYPGADDNELVKLLTCDFLKEGWLMKTGPRTGDAYRRRWVSLDKRKLMYYDEPLAAFPKGEIYLGTTEKGFCVRDGVPPTIKDPGCTFTLKTPDRHFHFAAETEEDKNAWMEVLREVIQKPLSPQDTSRMLSNNHK